MPQRKLHYNLKSGSINFGRISLKCGALTLTHPSGTQITRNNFICMFYLIFHATLITKLNWQLSCVRGRQGLCCLPGCIAGVSAPCSLLPAASLALSLYLLQFPVAIQLAWSWRTAPPAAAAPRVQLLLMMFLQLEPCLDIFIWFDIYVVCQHGELVVFPLGQTAHLAPSRSRANFR